LTKPGDSHRALSPENMLDLHYALLAALPKEGARLGYHPLTKRVPQLVAELNKPLPPDVPPVTSGEVNGAIRGLRSIGLAVEVRLSNGHFGYQATPRGQELAQSWTPPTFDQEDV
jgi:hypothetical protein